MAKSRAKRGRFIVCVKVEGEFVAFKFPSKKQQMGFLRDIEKLNPEQEYVFSVK